MGTEEVLQNKIVMLAEIMRKAESDQDLALFLQDIASPRELMSMIDRWEIAKLVNSGTSYREISKELGMSTATVTRVARALKFGNGYQKFIQIQ